MLRKVKKFISNMSMGARLGVICGLVLVALLGAAGSWVHGMYSRAYDGDTSIADKPDNIQQIDTILDDLPSEGGDSSSSSAKTDIYREEQQQAEVYNVILAGMDARGKQTKSRSDTIILMSYNTGDHSIKLVSFMRDSWVQLPERGWQRINAATAYGGIGLLVNTLNYNFGLDVQNYVVIRFDEFKEVIDIIGGVDMELTQKEINYINNKLHKEDGDYKNDITDAPGVIHLNGKQALWHCRNRTVGEGDFSRTSRQRDVLNQLIHQGLNMSVADIPALIDELSNHVSMNLQFDLIAKLATDAILHKDEITVEMYNVPFDGMYKYANKNGASVLELDIPATTEKLREALGYSFSEKAM